MLQMALYPPMAHRSALTRISSIALMSLGSLGRRAGRHVMEGLHVVRNLTSQFVDARDQCFKVVAVFNAGVFGDFLQTLAIQADQVHPQDGVIVIGCQFGGGVPDKQVKQFVHINAGLLDYLSCYTRHAVTLLLLSPDRGSGESHCSSGAFASLLRAGSACFLDLSVISATLPVWVVPKHSSNI